MFWLRATTEPETAVTDWKTKKEEDGGKEDQLREGFNGGRASTERGGQQRERGQRDYRDSPILHIGNGDWPGGREARNEGGDEEKISVLEPKPKNVNSR